MLQISDNIKSENTSFADQRKQRKSNQQQQIRKLQEVELLGGDGNYSKTERQIASVIGNALGHSSIDISYGFQKLGGNSILAVKVEMDMTEQGLNITLADLYSYDSIKALAAYLDGRTDHINIAVSESHEMAEIEILSDTSILNSVEPFSDIIYKGCFYSSLLPAVRYCKRRIDHYIINDIIVYDYPDKTDISSFGVSYLPTKTLEECIHESGVSMLSKAGSENIILDIESAVLQGKPVILCIDCYYEPINKEHFEKEHWPHNILIYGFNDREKIFHIIEHRNSMSTLYEKLTISYSNLSRCYEGYLEYFKNLDIVRSDLFELSYVDCQELPVFSNCTGKGGKRKTKGPSH